MNETATNSANAEASYMLACELFNVLFGAAKIPFASMEAQRHDIFRGLSIEMLQVLAEKFGCMSMEMTHKLQNEIHHLRLKDTQDLQDYINEGRDLNIRLGFAGERMSEAWLVNLVLDQLSSLDYKAPIEALVAAHSAGHTSFASIDDIVQALSADYLHTGLLWGGAPVTAEPAVFYVATGRPKSPRPYVKVRGDTPQVLVSSVSTSVAVDPALSLHPKHPWIGSAELSSDQVTILIRIPVSSAVPSNINSWNAPC